MGRKLLVIGAVVLVGALVLGTMAAWLVPGAAEAAQGKERGSVCANMSETTPLKNLGYNGMSRGE